MTIDISIITGKIVTTAPSSSNAREKKLYIKIFPGQFTMKAPRPKKAKVLVGELLVRYSSREWPEKKNGPLVGDPGFLDGVAALLREISLSNSTDISFAEEQRPIKETITIKVGPKLSQEIIDRGWAHLT